MKNLITIVLTKLFYSINLYPVESYWHKNGKIELMYDEDPNPKLFIVNKMHNRFIDMVEVFKENSKLIFQYSRSFYPEDNPFFRDSPIFLNSRKIKWEEIESRLQMLIVKLL